MVILISSNKPIDRAEFIKFFAGNNKLTNSHTDKNGVYVMNPLAYAIDGDKHPNMQLVPVWTKLSRGLLDSYRNCL